MKLMLWFLEVDEERRRISLGIKQTRANPLEEFLQPK